MMRQLSEAGQTLWFTSTLALRFLSQARVQTLIIVVGIVVGVAVIIFLNALIAGLQANLIERTLGTQAHLSLSAADERNQSPALDPSAEVWQLRLDDPRAQRLKSLYDWQRLMPALDAMPEITAVSPLVAGPALARRGQARASVSLMGVEPERYQRIVPIIKQLREGDFLLLPGQAVIGDQLAQSLGLRLGSKFRLDASDGREAVVTVAGIFHFGVRELDKRSVYINMKQAQFLLDLPGGVSQLDATVQDIFQAEAMAVRLQSLPQLKVESWMQTNAELLNALRSQSLASQLIAVFVALSVAIGIAAVLAVSVTQRTREIGILRAMGTTRAQMLLVFLFQGGLLGLLGALLGSVLGYGLAQLFDVFGPGLFGTAFSWQMVSSAVVLATLSGVLAALAPAWRAARLDPAEAIRYV